jgi:excisionase family DNA binding protein
MSNGDFQIEEMVPPAECDVGATSSPSRPEVERDSGRPSRVPGSKKWLTVQDVADELQVSRDTVERWIHGSQLRAANVSAARRGVNRPSWRVPRQALEEFLNARLNGPPTPAKPSKRRQNTGTIEFIK